MSVRERLLGRSPERDDAAIEVTRMRKRDLRSGVLAIEQQCYPRPWSQHVFASELDQVRRGSRFYVVARREREIVGYAGLWFTGDEAHVTNVAVEPTVRRQGIARRLMLALAAEVIERGVTAWTLEVRLSATGAQGLYRMFGFEPAGVRRKYYENVEDAIVMWCHEIQSAEYALRLDEIRSGAEAA